MMYFKKACKSINENSVFGFLTRSETGPPEHIGFIHESKQKRIKNLWRESTPERKNTIHPEEEIIDVNEG